MELKFLGGRLVLFCSLKSHVEFDGVSREALNYKGVINCPIY